MHSREPRNEKFGTQSLYTSDNKNRMIAGSPSEDQFLSPPQNKVKSFSDNKHTMSSRTENYKAPHLKALDSKLKNIIHEKKNRLMNNIRSPLQEVSSNQSSKSSARNTEDKDTRKLNSENKFLKKKCQEMQKIISELNNNTVANSHLEHLRREIESKNTTISQLEKANSQKLETQNSKLSKLKEVIEEEPKNLGNNDNTYMLQMLENSKNPDATLESLLTKQKISQLLEFENPGVGLQKLSSKVTLIFETLSSIAQNMNDPSLSECLSKASSTVKSQLEEILRSDDTRMEKLVAFVQENEDEKLGLIKEREELEEYVREVEEQSKEKDELIQQNTDLQEENTKLNDRNKEIEEINRELDEKLMEATEELKGVYDENSEVARLEEEIEELNNAITQKDQQ